MKKTEVILKMESGRGNYPVLTHLDINIGDIFLHVNKVWIRTGRFVAKSIGKNGPGTCHFTTLSNYLRDSSDEYKKFILLDQDEISDLLLNQFEISAE